jgi:hypothetical protein
MIFSLYPVSPPFELVPVISFWLRASPNADAGFSRKKWSVNKSDLFAKMK